MAPERKKNDFFNIKILVTDRIANNLSWLTHEADFVRTTKVIANNFVSNNMLYLTES